MPFGKAIRELPGAFLRATLFFALWTLSRAAEPPLTNIASVLALPPERASTDLPVHVIAPVTVADPKSGLLFVEDSGGGIFVSTKRALPPLRFGELLEIEGPTDPGLHVRAIRQATIK